MLIMLNSHNMFPNSFYVSHDFTILRDFLEKFWYFKNTLELSLFNFKCNFGGFPDLKSKFV
jgi:hypothetical protein